jgi:hypothetical protein
MLKINCTYIIIIHYYVYVWINIVTVRFKVLFRSFSFLLALNYCLSHFAVFPVAFLMNFSNVRNGIYAPNTCVPSLLHGDPEVCIA